MKICIPTMDENGLEGRLSAHFGRSPYFTLVDEATGTLEVIPNGQVQHEHGSCGPTTSLLERGPEVLVCRGLGGGAHARLRAAGLRVYLTEAESVAAALEAFTSGRLQEVAAAAHCCHGHGHTH